MKTDAKPKQVAAVRVITEPGLSAQAMPESSPAKIREELVGLPTSVSRSNQTRIPEPYKLIARKRHPENSVVSVDDVKIGDSELTIIVALSNIESREKAFCIAETLHRSGAQFLHYSAVKPPGSPFALKSKEQEALKLGAEIKAQFGLKIVVEVVDEATVDIAERYSDIIQIGGRNMQNFSLLRRAGRSHVPVILKRAVGATVDDWLLAAEYILVGGNARVVLCERGIRTFNEYTHATLDLASIPCVRRVSHLPILVDPSHSTGTAFMVAPLACAAIAAGAHGLLVEVNNEPNSSSADALGALTLKQYQQMISTVRAIHHTVSNGCRQSRALSAF